MKSYILKIQQLEGELMRHKFSTTCRNGLHDRIAMDKDMLLDDLGSGCEVGTPDASTRCVVVTTCWIWCAMQHTDCTAGFDWSTIRCFSSTGEASSVDDYLWLMGRVCYKPIIEYCGGTEIGGGFITESVLQLQALSAFITPAMGCNLFILDSSGNPLPHDFAGIGELALDPTLFGSSSTLLNVDHHEAYFSGMLEWNGKVVDHSEKKCLTLVSDNHMHEGRFCGSIKNSQNKQSDEIYAIHTWKLKWFSEETLVKFISILKALYSIAAASSLPVKCIS